MAIYFVKMNKVGWDLELEGVCELGFREMASCFLNHSRCEVLCRSGMDGRGFLCAIIIIRFKTSLFYVSPKPYMSLCIVKV